MRSVLLSATAIVLLTGVAAILFRKENPIKTDFLTAKDALIQIQEWAKWMTGLQTAAIAGLGWLVIDKGKVVALSEFQTTLSIIIFVCLGAAIFCSGWILSSVPSMLIRLSEKNHAQKSTCFDVYEQSLYGFSGPVKLAHLMSLNHWYWGVGLFCLGLLILLIFSGKLPR